MAKKKSEAVKKVEKQIKEMKEPVFIEKLELGGGEVYVGKLSQEDKYQLLTRHINIIEQRLNLIAQFSDICAICLEEICKEKGIDISKIINK